MARMPVRALGPTQAMRAACVFTAIMVGGWSYAQANAESAIHLPEQTAQPSPGASLTASPPGQASAAINPSPSRQPAAKSKPLWSDLTPAQQQALSPLAAEWDRLEPARKSKWLVIGNKYASMTPDEQQRIQERMRDWVKLTPQQRRMVRENYARAKTLNPDQKSAHWEKYQQLPEEQKQKLAADSESRKRVVTQPSATQSKIKTVPPIKSTPKPVLEQSVSPSRSAPQPQLPAQPAKE